MNKSTLKSSTYAQQEQHVFVVRMWWEPNQAKTSGEWRGMIEHVRTREKQYFQEIQSLPEKVLAMLEDSKPK